MPYVKDRAVILDVIQLISGLWLDIDHEVRECTIKGVLDLCEMGLPEAKECLGETAGAPLGLIEQLCRLLSDDRYEEKQMLQDLLSWKFSNHKKAVVA